MIFLLCLFMPSSAWALEFIDQIQITGNQRTEEDTIRATLHTQRGMIYKEERIREDILALYNLGLFRGIEVKKESLNKDGKPIVILTYVVEEKEVISKITFKGNKKVKEDDLREDLQFKPFQILDADKVAQSLQKMKDRYAEEGFHLADISTEQKKDEEGGGQELIFHIQENEGIKVKRVHFLGNTAFSDHRLKKILQTKERGYFSWLTQHGKYHEEVLQRDVAFLTYHYLNHGYIKVQVKQPRVYLTKNLKWLTVTFPLIEGDPYTISAVNVQGDILTTKEEILSKASIKAGELYSREKVDDDLRTLSTFYGDHGYAFAVINPVTIPDDATKTARLDYVIDKGHPVTVEKINISGNTVTRDKVIRRELKIAEGALYNESRIQESRRRLYALGFFEEVNFATPRGSSDDSIILNIKVKEKKSGSINVGAGFSTIESFVFQTSITKNNFFGYGIQGQFSLELSSVRQLFVLSFEDPHFLDTDWIFGMSGSRLTQQYEDFNRDSFGGTTSLGYHLFDYSNIRFIYEIEKVDIGAFKNVVPEPFAGRDSGLTSSLAMLLVHDTRDDRIFPAKGMYHSLSQQVSGTYLGGDSNFYRVSGNARYYYPFFGKKLILKSNFLIGYIRGLDDEPVPLFERFYQGGMNSLRGFNFRSVGPKVRAASTNPQAGDSEFVIGGDKQLQFNFESEVPIYNPAGFKLVLFVDMGNTFLEEESYDLNNLRSNYGFGLRWNSPFGVLRFEWGFPFDPGPADPGVVFNFMIGSFF